MNSHFTKTKSSFKKIVAVFSIAFLSLGIFAIPASPALATSVYANIYVRPDGSDTICNGSVNVAVGAFVGTDQPCAVKTIATGISLVATGGTVNVAAGTYTENVNVLKSLTLTGVGSASVIVNAANPAVSVFSVAVSSVNISGFTVSGATGGGQAGIYVGPDVANCNISNNILTGSFDGIWLGSGSNNNTLVNNTLTSNTAQGFELYHSDNNTLTNNHADLNTGYGFKMESSDSNILTDNTANSNTKYGFYLSAGSSDSDNNTFTNNTANSNTEYGMRMNSSYGNILIGNEFNSNGIDGIRLKDDVINLTLDNNSFTNNGTGIDIASGVGSVASWVVTDNNISGNTASNISNSATDTLDATNNWWGSAVDRTVQASISGDVTYTPYYIDAAMTQLSVPITPIAGGGTATTTATSPQVVVTDATTPLTIFVTSETTNPTIDVSSLLSEVNNIPQMTINTSLANVYIPATTVTSSDLDWNGIFEAPRITTVTLPTTTGSVNTLGVAIEIGLPDYTLTFGNGVRIFFPNQANKKVGFVRPGQAFTEITTICSADNQIVGDALAADGQCKINVGSDMVVWTKHFSKYATYSTNGVPNTGLKSQNIRFDGAMLIVGLLVVAGALRFSYRKN